MTVNPNPENAYALLAAIDPLPLPARMRTVAETARALAGTPALTSVLTDLNGGGVFERGLALTMAKITRTDEIVAAALADPDFGIRCRALDAVVRSPHWDEAVLATFDDAPIAWRRAVVRAVRKARRTDLADRIATAGSAMAGLAAATIPTSETAAATPLVPEQLRARLLPACSAQVVAELLPGLTHLPIDWLRLGKAHPNVVLDVVERGLDELPDGLRAAWWTRCADGVAGAAEAEPERVLRLLERYEVWQKSAFPGALAKRLRALAVADPVRTLRLLVDAEARSTAPGTGSLFLTGGGGWVRTPRMSRTVRRTLLLGAPEEAERWGLLCRDYDHVIALLLKTLPPAKRAAYFDAVNAGRDQSGVALDETVLDVLPRARRHREARRMLALPAVQAVPARRLRVAARLPWAEGRAELLSETRVADAASRASAYPLLIACAAAEADPEVFARFLGEDLGRLRNEQDPVRHAALGALADTPPALFDGRALEALARLATDAVEVRDRSAGALSSLRMLARRVLVHHAESGDAELLAWCLSVMEQIEGTTGAVDHERLDTLRRGQERAVVDVLAPWVRHGMTRGDHRRLLALVTALGRRAHAMADVQEWLAEAIWKGTDATATTAIGLWLEDRTHRDERVERLIAWDPTVARLWPVTAHIGRRRTDLLDRYLTGEVIPGRFVSEGTRWFPAFAIQDTAGWLPRQKVAYAKLLAAVAKDNGATVSHRVDAISRSAQLGDAGAATVRRFLTSTNVPLLEAALGALVWLPNPETAIPALLAYADGDRARVAVYAVTRAAQYARPSEADHQLRAVLASPTAKITSRKEAVRIAAMVGVPDLVELLLDTWNSEGQHRHVRMAAVPRLVGQLDDRRVWPALAAATTADRDVALEILRAEPLGIPARHRAEYGRFVAVLCAHDDQVVRQQAVRQAAGWYPWTPEAADAVTAAVLDPAFLDRGPVEAVGRLVGVGWPRADHLRLLRRLLDLAEAEHGADDRADDGRDGRDDTDTRTVGDPVFRDLPARRRLEDLAADLPAAARSALDDWRPVLTAVADLLAPEPGWLRQSAQLHAHALDLAADAETFTAGVRALADLTAGRPLTARTATEALSGRIFQGEPLNPTSFLAAASHLASDARASAGIVAVALTGAAGPPSGWAPAWRGVVRTLRRHPDPDVAELALRLNTEHTWQQ